jgi:hypothetical protein
VLESQSLDSVSQLDIYAEVVRVELELIAVGERLVLPDVHRESSDRPGDL